MPFKDILQPENIYIDETLRLRTPQIQEWENALPWYQNPKILYYSEGITDKIYDMDVINRMYHYLCSIGELYFIEILEDNLWIAIGDVTLSEKNMPIAIGLEKYWGKGIGKRVISKLLNRGRAIGLKKIHIPAIYLYNSRSENLFTSLGFVAIAENDNEKSYELNLE